MGNKISIDTQVTSPPTQTLVKPSSETNTGADLSYINVFADEFVDIMLLNSRGESVGQTYIQQPLMSDSNRNNTNNTTLRILDFPKPSSGQYKLIVNSNRQYDLEIFLYDRDGEYTIRKFNNVSYQLYSINFDKEDLRASRIQPLE